MTPRSYSRATFTVAKSSMIKRTAMTATTINAVFTMLDPFGLVA